MAAQHIIIAPTRQVERFQQLTELEVLELFSCAKEISKLFEAYFKAKRFNYLLQDGPEAGRRVNHVHLHLVPIRDDGVAHMNYQGGEDRTLQMMSEEVEMYKRFFEQ